MSVQNKISITFYTLRGALGDRRKTFHSSQKKHLTKCVSKVWCKYPMFWVQISRPQTLINTK